MPKSQKVFILGSGGNVPSNDEMVNKCNGSIFVE